MSSNNFDWYVKLGFVPERYPRVSEQRRLWERIWQETDVNGEGGWTRTPADGWDCLIQWLDEIEVGRPHGPAVRNYFWLEECRGAQLIFHVLIADWNGFSTDWEWRWKEISHGWAKTRELDDRTAGLLGYLVMQAGCVLKLNCGGGWGSYTALDFRPWTQKSY
jgi:hypothetical protein